ncbi:4-aminobutyrate--2-oxoglutarate transaminase [Oceanidesulfovibrio marinus]|uniref:4-aminobutyrate--2-oxoglutarate transaminase n=1 Tax=Oceanidesulfovibrio marinus TaxID=370038 RepID=A0ABX6NGQ1_9BACT|nr:4-aminobutyrate--2-oxoglutarate transaminase [Oceanidesulfovibrio marinus]QJT09742.1 4-aminobutyrate--2-oxoglutarate transaminase [Oceanidesulfovibrio marinus]
MPQTNAALFERRKKAVAKGVSNIGPIFVDHAEGAAFVDMDGREFIDFAGGIGVVNVGHCNTKVVDAIKEQADKLLHSCFHIAMYEGYVALAEKLVEISPGDFEKRAAFFNSGAEAVENAVKISRCASGKPGVIVFENSFHGRTLLTMTMTSKVKPYKFNFGPYAPEVYRMISAYCYRCPLGKEYPACECACADKLKDFFISNAAAENIACLIAEPILGEGGFITPPPEYFPKLQQICKDNDIIFVVDEVQAGMGRTGTMFAMEHWGVAADLTTVAKSMGGGMPISGVVGRADIMDAPHPGGLGGTYGGNPVSCAASLAAIDALQNDGLLDRAKELGADLRSRFEALQKKHPIIGDIRGKGPMLALEMVEDPTTKEPATAKTKALTAYCLEHGLILLSCGNYGNVIRTLMPLVITEEQLDKGMAILDAGLTAVCA